jgi:hypothetical protein
VVSEPVADDESDGPPPKPARRTLGIALAVAGAAALAIGGLSGRWMANPALVGVRGFIGSLQIAPRGADHCIDDWCRELSTGELNDELGANYPLDRSKYTSAAFAPAGWIALVSALVAALGLVGAAAIALARKQPQLPVSPASLALLGVMFALVAGCVFVATKPGPPGMVGVGWGFWLFGAGCIVGIAGSQVIARVIRPPDPDLLADAMDPGEFAD